MRILRIAIPTLILGTLALVGVAHADTVIIANTFDLGQTPPAGATGPNAPLSPTNANGLHVLGMTFGFKEGGSASSASLYGDTVFTGLNQLAPLSDHVLDGPGDGVLTLVFDMPTTFLSFDIAFTVPTGPGGQVTIGANSQPVSTAPEVGASNAFSIGSFSWTPTSAFTEATITFDSAAAAGGFAIDNLSYTAPQVPEPASIIFSGGGLISILAAIRFRKTAHMRL